MTKPECDTFWGSHGCTLPAGHDPEQDHPAHQCAVTVSNEDGEIIRTDVCSEAQYIDGQHTRTRSSTQVGIWSEWAEWELTLSRNDEDPAR